MADEHYNEQWRPVVGYEGWYEVSDHGHVKRIKAGRGARAGRILHPGNRHGYLHVALFQGGRSTKQSAIVHRLVLAAFVGPCPAGLQVNHKNGIKTDNRAENLEYVTPKENVRHAQKVLGISWGGGVRGEKQHSAKLTARIVQDIRHRHKLDGGISLKQLAAEYGVGTRAIAKVINRTNWKHVP